MGLKIKHAKDHIKIAFLDAQENPIKIVGDHLRIALFRWDRGSITLVFEFYDPVTDKAVGTTTEIIVKDPETKTKFDIHVEKLNNSAAWKDVLTMLEDCALEVGNIKCDKVI